MKATPKSVSSKQTRLQRVCNIRRVVVVEGDVDAGGKKGNREKSDFSINRNFQTTPTPDDEPTSLSSKSLATTSIVPPTRIPHNDIGLLSPAGDRIFTGTSSNPLSIVISHFSLRCGIAHTCFAGFTLGFSPSACCLFHFHLIRCLPLFLTYF